MSLRSLVLAPLAAAGTLALPSFADRVLVAGPDGFVMQADTVTGDFVYFACQCAGPIVALAADDQRLFAADEFGQLLAFDVHSGEMQALAGTGLVIRSLAAPGGNVFAGTDDARVVELDPLSGQELSSRTAPTEAPIDAMLAHDGFLFVGSGGAIWRAAVEGGEFEYFSCFCFSGIRGMVMEHGDMVVGDQNGIVVRIDIDTGELLAGFFTTPTNVFAASRGEVLLYYDGGAIPIFDAETGAPTRMLKSPIAVDAMLVIHESRRQPRQVGVPTRH